jgi:hypothetical protein
VNFDRRADNLAAELVSSLKKRMHKGGSENVPGFEQKIAKKAKARFFDHFGLILQRKAFATFAAFCFDLVSFCGESLLL